MTDMLDKVVNAMSQDVSPVLMQAVEDAREARAAMLVPSQDDDLEKLHLQIVSNRGRIERLEYLVTNLVLLKARAEANYQARKHEYDDAYVKAATKKSVGFADYSSAKEKDAAAQAETVGETMALRKAETNFRDVQAVHEFCKTLMWGAQGVQKDAETRLRIITLRSSLER